MRLTLDLDFLSPRLAGILPSFIRKWFIKRRFKRHRKRQFFRLMRVLEALRLMGIDPRPTRILVRYSRKGAHVYIWLDGEITPEMELVVRSILGDDIGRVSRDLLRIARKFPLMGLMFSVKKGKRHEQDAPELTDYLIKLWADALKETLSEEELDFAKLWINGLKDILSKK